MMTEAEREILKALNDLRVDVSDRLARIETQIIADVAHLALHTAQDAEQFRQINGLPDKPQIDSELPSRSSAWSATSTSPPHTRTYYNSRVPPSIRETAFSSIKQLSAYVADAIRAIEPEMTDVNVYANRLEPKWLEQAPSAKVAVELLLLRASTEIQRVPLVLRLMEAIGTDPVGARSELEAVAREQNDLQASAWTVRTSNVPPVPPDVLLAWARQTLFSTTFDMWTRQLVGSSSGSSTLYPGWRTADDSGRLLQAAGPHLMNAIDTYIGRDEAHWALAQTHAEAGLRSVAKHSDLLEAYKGESIPRRFLRRRFRSILANREDPIDALATLNRHEGWDGDFLCGLIERWIAQGALELEQARSWLWQQVGPERSTLELAYFHYALERLGPIDREQFFQKCHRTLAPEHCGWVQIPAGTFEMGSPDDEPERDPSEGPQHQMALETFFLSATTITNAEYEVFDPIHRERRAYFDDSLWGEDLGRHPVVHVSWWEAYLYCRWMGGALPTEAQWEYACRAGTVTPFSFGDSIDPEKVNYDGDAPYNRGDKGRSRGHTVAVGSLPANPWGLSEMHGNVWEWCEDWWGNYGEGPREGVANCPPVRVIRGGSFNVGGGYCRSAARWRFQPDPRHYSDCVGFRPVRYIT
jgi:formylglycine-generating enzyme required for sulfatase activity